MGANITIKADLRRVPRKVQQIIHDPRVLQHYGETVFEKMVNFMPQGATGNLVDNTYVTSDGYIIHNADYAHYMWEGEEYIWDAYQDANGEWHKLYFSPKDGEKHPSFEYGFSDYMIPGAFSQWYPHWEEHAYAKYKDEIAQEMTRFIEEDL